MPDESFDTSTASPTPKSLYDSLPDPADTLPHVFSIHHLVWLQRVGLLTDLPYELGPFPMTLDFMGSGKFDARIEEDLEEWGILVKGRNLHPEAQFLFDAITGHADWTLWGLVLLYSLKTNAREEFDPQKVDEFGLKHAVRDIPRVPFIIAVTKTEIVTALNAPPRLILHRIPRAGDVYKQVGEALRLMLDPEQNWEPWQGKRASLPFKSAKEIAADPELATLLDDEDARKKQAAAVKEKLLCADFSATTSKVLAELTEFPVSSSVVVNINYPTSKGLITPNASMSVNYFEGAGIVVSYPVGRDEDTRLLYYVPGDAAAFQTGVKALVELSEETSK